jgi:hypothetical protein
MVLPVEEWIFFNRNPDVSPFIGHGAQTYITFNSETGKYNSNSFYTDSQLVSQL